MLPVESQRREAAQEITVGRAAAQTGRRKARRGARQLEGQAAGAGPAGRHQPGEPGHDGRPVRAAGRAGSPHREPPRRHGPPAARVRRRLAADLRAGRGNRACGKRQKCTHRSSSSIICGPNITSSSSASRSANALRERAKALKVEEAKHAQAAIGYRRRREALFQKCGVADEQELRQLAARLDEAEELRKKRAAVTREIAAAIGKHGSEADFAPLLAADAIGRLEHDWEALSTQFEELDRELKDALQRRGAMVEQQRHRGGRSFARRRSRSSSTSSSSRSSEPSTPGASGRR